MIVKLLTYILGGENNTNSNCISDFWTDSNPRSTAKLSIINRSKAARIFMRKTVCLKISFCTAGVARQNHICFRMLWD